MRQLLSRLVLLGIAGFLFSQVCSETSTQNFQNELAEKMKQLREVRHKIFAIERKAAEQDETLKKINLQYLELQKKMEELNQQKEQRLNVLLKDNPEYQELKNKLESLRKELMLSRERRLSPAPSNAPPAN